MRYILLFLVITVIILNSIQRGACIEGIRVANRTTACITCNNTTWTVNNSNTLDIFVPTATQPEFASFRNNAAAINVTVTPGFTCGCNFTVIHTAGTVAPVDKTVTYGTVLTNIAGTGNKCWITQNLGATRPATSATDASEDAAGWYWQFNKKQGYKHNGTTRTPSTAWITSITPSAWSSANDPCTLLLGPGWRLPTCNEWDVADANGGWTGYGGTYSSVLKIHASGRLEDSNGALYGRGVLAARWSSGNSYDMPATAGCLLNPYSSYCDVNAGPKACGTPVRCLKD